MLTFLLFERGSYVVEAGPELAVFCFRLPCAGVA